MSSLSRQYITVKQLVHILWFYWISSIFCLLIIAFYRIIKKEIHQERYHTVPKKTCKYSNELFKCTLCAFETKKSRYLKKHQYRLHNETRITFKCMKCSYEVKDKRDLIKHYLVKHDNSHEIFKCEACPYQTKIKSRLKTHSKVHNDSRENFKCMDCDFQTNAKRQLKRHRYLIHVATKSFKCTHCLFATKTEYQLKKHFAIHRKRSKTLVFNYHKDISNWSYC